MNSQEAKEYWDKMKEQEKMFPQAHIYTNIKNQGVDMEQLAQTNPYLFEMFTRIFSGVETPATIQTWKYYQQAYNELEAQGLLNILSNRELFMQQKIDDFVKKVDGPNLVPVSVIEEVVTEKKRKGNVSIQVDFENYMNVLENYYGIRHRDFFQRFDKEPLDYVTILGLTQEEFDKHYKMSPRDSLVAAKITVLNDIHEQQNGMPYADFWNYLIDHDFMDVSNGSVHSLWIDHETEDSEDDDIIIPGIVFDKMRTMMFKELSQHSYYQNKVPNEIEFYISW